MILQRSTSNVLLRLLRFLGEGAVFLSSDFCSFLLVLTKQVDISNASLNLDLSQEPLCL